MSAAKTRQATASMKANVLDKVREVAAALIRRKATPFKVVNSSTMTKDQVKEKDEQFPNVDAIAQPVPHYIPETKEETSVSEKQTLAEPVPHYTPQTKEETSLARVISAIILKQTDNNDLRILVDLWYNV